MNNKSSIVYDAITQVFPALFAITMRSAMSTGLLDILVSVGKECWICWLKAMPMNEFDEKFTTVHRGEPAQSEQNNIKKEPDKSTWAK